MNPQRRRLTVGQFSDSLRSGTEKATIAITQALLKGPQSIGDLMQATGLTEAVVMSAIRSQPGKFTERDNLVHKVARA